ncbi:MAG: 50S ribosomal protein L25/general stress protein Ctc [Legionellaceae bacterium]|nr:50S ribosomal protein L25/general stress protein Ctc [Legionellaceae bacterium]MBP9776128.1 50S ribosomal protein L25/general stress protein Ctc [Legionellaceae bacterium]
MSTVMLEAQARDVQGKGASRRLRRLEQMVPAIVYGSDKEPQLLSLSQHKVNKALENEAIYSTVFQLHVDGKAQQVILKDLQRHPYKPVILHMDFQRVSAKDVLVKMIPLHFINGDTCPGHKDGGVISHVMSQVEVRCQAQYLPEFIEVDLSNLELDGVVHLSDLKLPKNVELATAAIGEHDQPIANAHLSHASEALEAELAAEAEASDVDVLEEGAEVEAGDEASEEESEEKDEE